VECPSAGQHTASAGSGEAQFIHFVSLFTNRHWSCVVSPQLDSAPGVCLTMDTSRPAGATPDLPPWIPRMRQPCGRMCGLSALAMVAWTLLLAIAGGEEPAANSDKL